ncbi:pyrimidine-nucleoside phosphorylase [Lentibacillus cibarius]|uniref:Pyrimidine-nucleoside phosphorylase n=1 Tax=Lentibacillus cibarius TaxID=2583219 RepID=A0A549YL66_9BACI|nr:pyrimidine-nucleoside phosphorylase [Lentibacillus cibarius]TRM12626.1 pyrimidine-nucleoside phosphorylase [Lentibacillus cibarius]
MRMYDLIEKKRDGKELTKDEIHFFIDGYTNGDIPDYQVSALLMATFFQDMTEAERAELTASMVASGEQIDLSAISGVKVDKHSTGGVGDTTTLILAPLVASVGVPVAKMSGRGLGHTGGTIDKLEAIPGFHVELSNDEFIDSVNKNKVAVVGQTGNLTPADKKLYSLRDVTATVNSIPLIASSIMSKKIASGADAIVLDVKTGTGAFMKDYHEAKALAEAMVSIGNHVGRDTLAIISDMNQPLGKAIGNALEVKEAIDTLQGNGPSDLTALCLELGSHMTVLAGKADTVEEAKKRLTENLNNGKALERFKTFVESQGGDPRVIDHPELLPQATHKIELPATKSGTVSEIIADDIGTAAMMLGAGRSTKNSEIDLSVGIVLHKKIGDTVNEGEPLVTIHTNDSSIDTIKEKLYASISVSDHAVEAPTLIHSTVR